MGLRPRTGLCRLRAYASDLAPSVVCDVVAGRKVVRLARLGTVRKGDVDPKGYVRLTAYAMASSLRAHRLPKGAAQWRPSAGIRPILLPGWPAFADRGTAPDRQDFGFGPLWFWPSLALVLHGCAG